MWIKFGREDPIMQPSRLQMYFGTMDISIHEAEMFLRLGETLDVHKARWRAILRQLETNERLRTL